MNRLTNIPLVAQMTSIYLSETLTNFVWIKLASSILSGPLAEAVVSSLEILGMTCFVSSWAPCLSTVVYERECISLTLN